MDYSRGGYNNCYVDIYAIPQHEKLRSTRIPPYRDTSRRRRGRRSRRRRRRRKRRRTQKRIHQGHIGQMQRICTNGELYSEAKEMQRQGDKNNIIPIWEYAKNEAKQEFRRKATTPTRLQISDGR